MPFDVERDLLAIAISSGFEKVSNGADGLAMLADHAADIRIRELHFEHMAFAVHPVLDGSLLGMVNQLRDHELEELAEG